MLDLVFLPSAWLGQRPAAFAMPGMATSVVRAAIPDEGSRVYDLERLSISRAADSEHIEAVK